MALKIAVVGSRTFNDFAFARAKLSEIQALLGDFIVVSGGARGADSLAEAWAKKYSQYTPAIFPARWFETIEHPEAVLRQTPGGSWYNAAAGHLRNKEIVAEADLAAAFMDPGSPTPGTKDTLELAEKAGKPAYVFWPQGRTFNW